jgi:hypothetical protein
MEGEWLTDRIVTALDRLDEWSPEEAAKDEAYARYLKRLKRRQDA